MKHKIIILWPNHKYALTTNIKEMVSITVMTNMDENPIINRVLRPVSSTKNREISVIITLSVPMPRVAYLAPSSVIPAILKIFVEKNMTWKNKKFIIILLWFNWTAVGHRAWSYWIILNKLRVIRVRLF